MGVYHMRLGSLPMQPITDVADIEAALEELNQGAYLSFALIGNLRFMVAFSGVEARVIVEYRIDEYRDGKRDNRRLLLYDLSQTSPLGPHSENMPETSGAYVNKSLAKQALKHFYETEEMLDTLTWREWSMWPPVWEIHTKDAQKGVSDWKQIEEAVDTMSSAYDSFLFLSNMRNGNIHISLTSAVNRNRVLLTFRDHGTREAFFLIDSSQTIPITILYLFDWAVWPSEYGIDRELAKRALKYFFETQDRALSLEWRGWPDKE